MGSVGSGSVGKAVVVGLGATGQAVARHLVAEGWQVVIVRFWVLAGLSTAMALGLFYADYISITRIG